MESHISFFQQETVKREGRERESVCVCESVEALKGNSDEFICVVPPALSILSHAGDVTVNGFPLAVVAPALARRACVAGAGAHSDPR